MAAPDPRIAFFDRNAPTWDQEGPALDSTIARLAALQEVLGLHSGQDLLEVGCGTGALTPWLKQQVAPGRVTAIDFSSEMLAHAKTRGVDADFQQLDVCSDPLGYGDFDVVWVLNAFPHFRDQRFAMRNFTRALRPGGILLVIHLDNWQNINSFHDQVGPPVQGDYLPPPDAWVSLINGAGLQRQELENRHDLFLLKATRPGAE